MTYDPPLLHTKSPIQKAARRSLQIDIITSSMAGPNLIHHHMADRGTIAEIEVRRNASSVMSQAVGP